MVLSGFLRRLAWVKANWTVSACGICFHFSKTDYDYPCFYVILLLVAPVLGFGCEVVYESAVTALLTLHVWERC